MMYNLEISKLKYSKRQMRGCLHGKLFAREQNKAQPYVQLESGKARQHCTIGK